MDSVCEVGAAVHLYVVSCRICSCMFLWGSLRVMKPPSPDLRARRYGYRGLITGWDPLCAMPEQWILQMDVDALPGATLPSSATLRMLAQHGICQPPLLVTATSARAAFVLHADLHDLMPRKHSPHVLAQLRASHPRAQATHVALFGRWAHSAVLPRQGGRA